MISEIVLLDKLTKAIAFAYKDDKTAPGVTVAALPTGQYYCSVVRYDGAFAKGKKVVCGSTASTLGEAVRQTANDFLSKKSVVKNPVDELNDALNQ